MDVLCVGMYRACSTWQYEVAAHLVERHRHGRLLGFVLGEDYARRERLLGPGRGWRVLKSHEGHREFAAALAGGRARAIYARRDLRDVVFSFMFKRGMAFDEFLREGLIHQVVANDRFWSARPLRLDQRYEDLIADPAAGVEGIAAHLGIELEPGEADEVASEYSFERNRRRTIELRRRLRQTVGDLDDPALSQIYDGRTLLHWNHLRDGRPGGWRESATPRQRAAMHRVVGRWLIEHGYESDDSWVGDPFATNPLERVKLEAEVARGDVACRLRGLSMTYPRLANAVKVGLRIPVVHPLARPAPEMPRPKAPFTPAAKPRDVARAKAG
jgi:hypothetical protein